MENQTSFDLNQTIRTWRENLGQSPAFQGENLDELESHLRDSISTLQTRGLSVEEACMVAVKRAGAASPLAAEFGKVNRQAIWLDRILWMLVGLQLWGMVAGVLNGLARAVSTIALANWNIINPDHRAVAFAVVATFFQLLALAGSLAVCWWLVMRQGPAVGGRFSRLSKWQTVWICVGLLVCRFVVWLLPTLGFTALLARFVPANTFQVVMRTQAYSGAVSMICQVTVLLILTILLARKRHTIVKAA